MTINRFLIPLVALLLCSACGSNGLTDAAADVRSEILSVEGEQDVVYVAVRLQNTGTAPVYISICQGLQRRVNNRWESVPRLSGCPSIPPDRLASSQSLERTTGLHRASLALEAPGSTDFRFVFIVGDDDSYNPPNERIVHSPSFTIQGSAQ